MCVLLLRFLTYCYLLAFNAWLLLAPIVLCYDWQVGSIPLVETAWDTRNAASLLLALGLLALCLHCLLSLQVSKALRQTYTHRHTHTTNHTQTHTHKHTQTYTHNHTKTHTNIQTQSHISVVENNCSNFSASSTESLQVISCVNH